MPVIKGKNREKKNPDYCFGCDSPSMQTVKVFITTDHGEIFGNPTLLKEIEDFLQSRGHERLIAAEPSTDQNAPTVVAIKPTDGFEN